jgi:hypothetical protein
MKSRSYYIAAALIALLTLVGAGSALLLLNERTGDKQVVSGPAGPTFTLTLTPTHMPARVTPMITHVPTKAAPTSDTPMAAATTPTLAAPASPTPDAANARNDRQPQEADGSGRPGPDAELRAQATAEPGVQALQARPGGPVAVPNSHPGPRWVTLQVGHWHNELLPDELRHLVDNTGAYAAGVSEVEINEAVAKLTARLLHERGYSVEILGATVPISYTTDLFIALHADGNVRPSWRGFKAVAPWNSTPESDKFVEILYEEYGKATGLPTDALTTESMADYYAFNSDRYRHAIAPGVPAAILEMGFVTNPEDRKVLTTRQDQVAWGIANAADRFFRSGVVGDTPTPYPTFTPTTTPTTTPTSTPTTTATSTATSTSTVTPVPTELASQATETAAVSTPTSLAPTPPQPSPTPTRTPVPTPTPLQPIITADGRWLPPLSPNGRSLPPPGSSAPPVLLSEAIDRLTVVADGRERAQVWQQFYVPELGRSVWRKGPLRQVRD